MLLDSPLPDHSHYGWVEAPIVRMRTPSREDVRRLVVLPGDMKRPDRERVAVDPRPNVPGQLPATLRLQTALAVDVGLRRHTVRHNQDMTAHKILSQIAPASRVFMWTFSPDGHNLRAVL